MLCKKCKSEIPDGSAYCNRCGAKQSEKRRTRRGNGQGSAYKRGNTWQAEITLGFYADDTGTVRRRRMTKGGFRTKREALEYIETLRSGKKPKSITFDTLWVSFGGTIKPTLSKSKQTAYNIAWKKIQPYICYRDIADMTADELQKITDSAGSSYYTKRDIKNLLSHFYKLAMRDEYVTMNKATFILLPKLEKTERDIFTDEEIGKLWEDWQQHSDVITAHILIMLYTGMRPGEVLTVQKKNVYLSEHYMTGGIKTAKGRNRKIIIPDKIVTVVSAMIERSVRDTLSPYSDENDFYYDFNDKKAALGLNKSLVPYCCRHTYVTKCTRLKMSPAMLQELTGHEDYDTTLDYTHLSIADRLSEVNKL